MSQPAEHLENLITQAGGLPVVERRALLLQLTGRFLDEACPEQERQRLSIVIGRIGATLEAQNGAEPEPPSHEEKLISLLRSGAAQEFIACLAQITGIAPEEMDGALHGGNGEALARACKTAGLDRATYSAIVVLSDPARTPEQTEALLQLYDAASPADPQVTHAAA